MMLFVLVKLHKAHFCLMQFLSTTGLLFLWNTGLTKHWSIAL